MVEAVSVTLIVKRLKRPPYSFKLIIITITFVIIISSNAAAKPLLQFHLPELRLITPH